MDAEKDVQKATEKRAAGDTQPATKAAAGEVDLTQHAKRFLRYGLLGLIAIAVLCAGGIYFYQHAHQSFTCYDAQVTSTMVAARAKAPGTIAEMVVADGEHVEAGDVIAHVQVKVTEETLTQLQQNLQLAQQNLAQVQKGQTVMVPSAAPAAPVQAAPENSALVASAANRMQRMQELYAMGAVSAVERDQAVADYQSAVAAATPATSYSPPSAPQLRTQPASPEAIKQAELAVKQAEAALQTAQQDAQATDIVAPVAGTVYYTGLAEGDEIQAGDTLVNIGDASNIWVEARLQPQDKDKVRLGQFVEYTVEDASYQGSVQEITDPAEAETEASANSEGTPDTTDARLTVRISLPDSAAQVLKPGMSAVVKFMLTS